MKRNLRELRYARLQRSVWVESNVKVESVLHGRERETISEISYKRNSREEAPAETTIPRVRTTSSARALAIARGRQPQGAFVFIEFLQKQNLAGQL